MACRMSILRLWRAAVSNLRMACVAVSNLGVWGLYIARVLSIIPLITNRVSDELRDFRSAGMNVH